MHDYLDRYRQLRATGKRLISKMYDAAGAPQYSILKAAKKLTIPVGGPDGRTLIFDGETDTTALADFYLHEMRYGGKRIVDVLADSPDDLLPEERALLAGHCASRCSLFEVKAIDPVVCQLRLHDVLHPERLDLSLTDISLSTCGAVRLRDLLFTRLVHCDGITMSAGIFFGFRGYQRDSLLEAYEARMLTVGEKDREQRTYVFFYQRNRELGLEQAYQDVA